MIFRTAWYSTAQLTLVVLLLQKKKKKTTVQWFHVKTFEFVFYCSYCQTSILFVCFCFLFNPFRFRFQGAKIFNNLPIEIRESEDAADFRKRLAAYF